MSASQSMVAEILEASAAGFASAANVRLHQDPTLSAPDFPEWRDHFRQRVLELAAAIRIGDPALFARRIMWLRRAAQARGFDEQGIGQALKCLRQALKDELPVEMRAQVQPALTLAIAELDNAIEPEVEALDPKHEHGRLGLQYIAACLDAEPERAMALILEAVDNGMAAEEIFCEVLIPATKEVGQLWHVGDISVAEERLVTETTFRVVALVVARSRPAAKNGKRVLLAAVPGNAHELGLRIVADLFTLAGWQSLYLGSNVPSSDIARAASAYGIDLVVLTATLTTQLSSIATTAADIKRASPETKIMVGGIAFDESPESWRHLGADGFSPRTEEAVARGVELVSLS